MNGWAKAALEGAACELMIGVVLVAGGRVWRPANVGAQAERPAVAEVVRARRLEVVDVGHVGNHSSRRCENRTNHETLGILPGILQPGRPHDLASPVGAEDRT